MKPHKWAEECILTISSLREYDENDNFVRDVYEANLNALDGWSFWSINGSGSNGLSSTVGHNDTGSLYIDGTTGDGNMGNIQQRFVVRPTILMRSAAG